MNISKVNISKHVWIGIISVILIVCYLFACWVGVLKENNLAYEICAAVIGVLITAIITALLLDRQSDAQIELRKKEEEADKNVKNYERKIQVYSEFISEMCLSINDKNGISEENFDKIRNKFCGNLLLYVNDSYYPMIREAFSQIEVLDNKKNSEESYDANSCATIRKNQEAFATIVKILQSDLQGKNYSDEGRKQLIDLFDKIFDEPAETINEYIPNKSVKSNFTGQFWHMVMWGKQQFEFFKNINEGNSPNSQSDDCVLSLFEYEESDRTNRLKQVNIGDVVFLYCRGGNGYVGVFKVKGYKVFDYKDKTKTFNVSGEPENEKILTELEKDEDIKKYDIYGTYKDVEDEYSDIRCADLVVEPLIFCKSGVSYVGGVYRRTISRYPRKRAKSLIGRFLFELANHKDKCQYLVKQKEQNVTMSYTANDFVEFAKSCGVTEPAKKDSKDNWIDE